MQYSTGAEQYGTVVYSIEKYCVQSTVISFVPDWLALIRSPPAAPIALNLAERGNRAV